jgi:hypothetical protein
MERSRIRTLLGLLLIVIGVISLSHALMRPLFPPPLPPMPALAPLPPLPPLPPMPALAPLPPMPALHHMAHFSHWGSWFSPPIMLLALLLLAIWLRRRGSREAPLA